jgi:hypothetical protein
MCQSESQRSTDYPYGGSHVSQAKDTLLPYPEVGHGAPPPPFHHPLTYLTLSNSFVEQVADKATLSTIHNRARGGSTAHTGTAVTHREFPAAGRLFWGRSCISSIPPRESYIYYIYRRIYDCVCLLCLNYYNRYHGNAVKRQIWLSSGLLRRVVWQKFTDVSEVLAASINRAWRQ